MKHLMINDQHIIVISTVDTRGLLCPMPVVKLKLELDKVGLHQVVELLADDAGVLEDLPAWCRETGNRLVSIRENTKGNFVAYVEKKVE